MSNVIFVSGATGTTGTATVQALIAKGAAVVAGVHSALKAKAFTAGNVPIRQFDLADVPGMTVAMEGADRLYLVTPVSEHTAFMTAAIVEAARGAGIRHGVKLSGLNVDSLPDLDLARWHCDAENVIRASGLEWTFLRANSFMQNFEGAIDSIRTQQLYFNTYGAASVSLVDARDIGEVAAKVLLSDGHFGRIYNLTGPRGITREEVVQLATVASDRAVRCVDLGGDDLTSALGRFGLSAAVAAATAQLLGHMATGAAAAVSTDIETLLGRSPRDLTQWFKENAQAFR